MCSYYNIVTFISYTQGLGHTNRIYVVSVYVSIVCMLVDTIICAMTNSALFVVYNLIYLTCVINTVMTYGNLLSILIFVFESTNVSVDWFCLNCFGFDKTNIRNVTSIVIFSTYVFVNKVVITPIVIMSLYYNVSGNITQPLFMISFSFYVTNLIKLFEIVKPTFNEIPIKSARERMGK